MTRFKRNILVLDDDAELIDELRKNFSWEGHEVFSGVEGLKALMTQSKSGIPDLIILDPMLTTLNGYEFFKTFKQDPSLSGTPVMILTSREGLRETYEKLGCDYFAAKPAAAAEVVGRAASLLVRSLLVLESDAWIKNRLQGILPESLYRLKFESKMKDLFPSLSAGYYHAVLCTVDLIVAPPAKFVAAVKKASKNRGIRIVVYYEESPDASEITDVIMTEKVQRRWRAVQEVGYYDARLDQKRLADYLAETV